MISPQQEVINQNLTVNYKLSLTAASISEQQCWLARLDEAGPIDHLPHTFSGLVLTHRVSTTVIHKCHMLNLVATPCCEAVNVWCCWCGEEHNFGPTHRFKAALNHHKQKCIALMSWPSYQEVEELAVAWLPSKKKMCEATSTNKQGHFSHHWGIL